MGGIFSVLVNYIPISIVQKTLKERNTILSINKAKCVVKCKCLKIAMELFTFWRLYGLIFDWLLDYITLMVNIEWLEDIVCLHKCAASLKEENGCIFNTGLLLSRISFFSPKNTCLFFVYFHLIFISCLALSVYLTHWDCAAWWIFPFPILLHVYGAIVNLHYASLTNHSS